MISDLLRPILDITGFELVPFFLFVIVILLIVRILRG